MGFYFNTNSITPSKGGSGGGQPSSGVDWGQSLQGDITTDATFICAPYKLYGNGYVTSFSAPNLEKLGSLYETFDYCENMTSAILGNITEVGKRGMQTAFNRSGLTNINNFEENITIIDFYGMFNCFSDCNLLQKVFNFKSLTSLGDSALNRAFANTKVPEIYFRALTSQSFNSFNNQLNSMLSGVTGCTVHFPSNLQAVIGSWSSVTGGFGGTNTTVLFDLPATS